MRNSGEVPAIIYGNKGEVVHISVTEEVLLLHLQAQVKELMIKYVDGREEAVMVKKVHYNSLTSTLLHVDFCRIAEQKKAVEKK